MGRLYPNRKKSQAGAARGKIEELRGYMVARGTWVKHATVIIGKQSSGLDLEPSFRFVLDDVKPLSRIEIRVEQCLSVPIEKIGFSLMGAAVEGDALRPSGFPHRRLALRAPPSIDRIFIMFVKFYDLVIF